MDKTQSPVTEQVLNLTMEIIFLLTGEDYFVVKKLGGRSVHNNLQVVGETTRTLTDGDLPTSQSVIREPQNRQEILDVTHKIIKLLTEEVPIRCQDVSVHFSMEEWDYIEEHKDQYQDLMMEDHQNLMSTGSREAKEERCGERLNPDIFIPKDHIQQNIKEEPVLYDRRAIANLDKSQYPFTRIKEEASSSDEVTLEKTYTKLLDPKEHSLTSLHKDVQVLQDSGDLQHTNLFAVLQTLPSPFKEDQVLQIGEDPTNLSVFTISDQTQECPNGSKESDPSQGGICNTPPYPSTHVTVGEDLPNPPEPQNLIRDNITLQFACSECNKCFLSMAELVTHQGIHIAEKLLQTGTRVFTTALVQTPQEPPVKHKLLTCSICGRTFYTKSSLVGHTKAHWRRNLKCEQCGKFFSNSFLLNVHSRLHVGERPYACSTCGERFMRNSDLGRHCKKHQ